MSVPRLGGLAAAAGVALWAGCAPIGTAAAPEPLAGALRPYLDSLPDGRVVSLAVGRADTARNEPMRPSSRLLQGSVGKTYVAAVALQLVREGVLDLDAPISTWLGEEPWFPRLPNARGITLRMLMNHTSGVVRYELDEAFLRDLLASPRRRWTVADRVAYVLDREAPFPAGEGWSYSDTNYILVGAIVERATGMPLVESIRRRLLGPLGLDDTVPTDRPAVPGVVQGYAGPRNPFGGVDAMLVDGAFVVSPQFEWAGGGYASTAADLARWARALYRGDVLDAATMAEMLRGVAAPGLGPGSEYGLGVILRPTPLGPSRGHSGFFPGYLAEVRYYPEHDLAVAFQVNTSAPGALGRAPGEIVDALAERAVRALTPRRRPPA